MISKDKISVVTLGCSKNTVDSERLMNQIKANNLNLVNNPEEAETIIINTCGFIEAAKQESINTIVNAVALKQEGKLKKVIVAGCLSERHKSELEKEISGVDVYFGTEKYEGIINELGGELKRNLLGERLLSTPSHTAYLKISEGCDHPCSFCAIPLMRGKHKSKPIEELIKEAEFLAKNNAKELVIIAQDTTDYGKDIYGRQNIAELLDKLSEIDGIEWIRLMYAYPSRFPVELIDIIANNPKVCKYVDIPLQHISDDVLKSMRRGTTGKQIRKLLYKLREKIPGVVLRTTFIVGYPNETEEKFRELCDFVREIKFDRFGTFTYSIEENTAGFILGDPVPEEIKLERKEILMELQKDISLEKNKELLGKKLNALVEGREGDFYVARSYRDAPEVDGEMLIPVNGAEIKAGNFYLAKVFDYNEYDLYAEVISRGEAPKMTLKIISLLALVFGPVYAQQVEDNHKWPETTPRYFHDLLSFASEQDNMTRVDVFIKISYDKIQFLKINEGFEANYSVTVSVYDEDKEKLIVEKSWNEKLVAKDFSQTVSKNNFNLSLRSFELQPGKYLVRTAVEDKDSKKEYTSENIYNVRDLSKFPSVSDIMFIAKQTQVEGSNKIVPNVSGEVNVEKDSLKIFFEIYADMQENISIEYSIKDKEDEILFTATEEKKIDSGRNQMFSSDTTFKNLKLGFGGYTLLIKVKDSGGNQVAEVSKVFTSHWIGIPSEPDKAIAQLVYIATPSEMDYMEEAGNEEEKIERYREFWRKKDPTPNTEENELYNEYSRRVAYANENFTHYIEGWRSDRGMIFIILGSPNNVDRHPFDLESKPYEVWQYYELNRNFVFVDETGFGDYRLVTPLYGEDYRFRN